MHTTLGDWLLEPVANAIEAGARAVQVEVVEEGPRVTVTVSDDGPGITSDAMRSLLDPLAGGNPHKHPGRRPHLGLPMLGQAVRQAGGDLAIESEPGVGTVVRWTLDATHPDAPPSGDWAAPAAAVMAMAAGRGVALRWRRQRDGHGYELDNLEWLDGGGATRAEAITGLRRRLAALESKLRAAPESRAPVARWEMR